MKKLLLYVFSLLFINGALHAGSLEITNNTDQDLPLSIKTVVAGTYNDPVPFFVSKQSTKTFDLPQETRSRYNNRFQIYKNNKILTFRFKDSQNDIFTSRFYGFVPDQNYSARITADDKFSGGMIIDISLD